jgi:hypothetical protein
MKPFAELFENEDPQSALTKLAVSPVGEIDIFIHAVSGVPASGLAYADIKHRSSVLTSDLPYLLLSMKTETSSVPILNEHVACLTAMTARHISRTMQMTQPSLAKKAVQLIQ